MAAELETTTEDVKTTTETTETETSEGEATTEATTEDAPVSRSILDDAEGDDDVAAVTPGDWPDDWRDKAVSYITDDKSRAKELKRLQRIKTPTDMYKSYRSLGQKMAEDTVAKLPQDATDKQLSDWRKSNNVPAKVEDYKAPDIKGHEWSDADQPMLESYFEGMHKTNATQAQTDAALTAYTDAIASALETQGANDVESRQAIEDQLRANHGNRYRGNLKLWDRYLNDTEVVSVEMKDALDGARTADGRLLMNVPGFADYMIGEAVARYGEGAVVTSGEARMASDRKGEIQQIMKHDIRRYREEGLDKEYRAILEREESGGRRR